MLVDVEKIIELKQLEESVGVSILPDLFGMLEEQLLGIESKFIGWCESREFSKIRDFSHQISSSAGNLGASELSSLCIQIERLIDGKNFDEVRQKIVGLDELGGKTVKKLKEHL